MVASNVFSLSNGLLIYFRRIANVGNNDTLGSDDNIKLERYLQNSVEAAYIIPA